MIEVKIPKLGLTMEKATVVKWNVRSGDLVRKDDVVLVIETDKVTYEVSAPEDGIIHPIATEGSVCAVEQTVAFIAFDRKEYEVVKARFPEGADKAAAGDQESKREVKAELYAEDRGAPRIKASPLARAMAREHKLLLSEIKGTGPSGRIIRRDILAALRQRETQRSQTESTTVPMRTTVKTVLEAVPIKGARRVISDNMFMSISTTAQLTLHTEACAEALVSLRKRLGKDGDKPSYNAILVKAASWALRRHPRINASISGSEIHVWKEINIGVAMESGDYLVVPVVRDADIKSIRDIEKDISELVNKARRGGLSPDDMTGGTFTITNLGFADIDHFTPILRPPETAILGVGRIVSKPWVRDDELVVEVRMALSLTFDHRVVDGAPAGRFLKDIKDAIEEPLLMLA